MKKLSISIVLILLGIGTFTNSVLANPILVGEKAILNPDYDGEIGLWIDSTEFDSFVKFSVLIYWKFTVNNSINITAFQPNIVIVEVYNKTPVDFNLVGRNSKGNASQTSPLVHSVENRSIFGYSFTSVSASKPIYNTCFEISIYFIYSETYPDGIFLNHIGCINDEFPIQLDYTSVNSNLKPETTSEVFTSLFFSLLMFSVLRKRKRSLISR